MSDLPPQRTLPRVAARLDARIDSVDSLLLLELDPPPHAATPKARSSAAKMARADRPLLFFIFLMR